MVLLRKKSIMKINNFNSTYLDPSGYGKQIKFKIPTKYRIVG